MTFHPQSSQTVIAGNLSVTGTLRTSALATDVTSSISTLQSSLSSLQDQLASINGYILATSSSINNISSSQSFLTQAVSAMQTQLTQLNQSVVLLNGTLASATDRSLVTQIITAPLLQLFPCMSSPCQGQLGICITNGPGSFTCLCPLNYGGTYCQYPPCRSSSDCLNGGQCIQNEQSQCRCAAGFTGFYCESAL